MTAKSELNYKKNIFVSIYITITIIGSTLFISFLILLLLKIFSGQDLSSQTQKKEEPRYQVQYRQIEKPKKFIENQNENQKAPDKSAFLSEKNSTATSPTQSNKDDGPVFQESKVDQFDIKSGEDQQKTSKENQIEDFLSNKSSTESIFGKPEKKSEKKQEDGFKGKSDINMIASSQQRSGTFISDPRITLSTYEWEYAPYLQVLKRRVYKYWSVPAAYYMGLIGGETKIKFTISRNGKMTYFNTLGHYGDGVLRKSSEDVVHAIFDMPELPPDFPDQELTLVISLYYPKR